MIDISKQNLFQTFIKYPKKKILMIFFLVGFGEWFISDLVHFPGGTLGFIILCCGGYLYFKNEEPKFIEPRDITGWINLCNEDINYFNELEEKNNLEKKNILRKNTLKEILSCETNQSITFVGDSGHLLYKSLLDKYIKNNIYNLNVLDKLPSQNLQESSLNNLCKSDAVFYHLDLPLTAKGLLWLNKLPKDMPIWLVISNSISINERVALEELKAELPGGFIDKIINIDLVNISFNNIPFSFWKFTLNPRRNKENTKKRLLRQLHGKWQAEIEVIRRMKLKEIQRKSQIFVAASVFASPIPSLDVLSMTVLNSLMIKEIKAIWSCNWSPEVIEKISKEIIKIAIAQGVVEWSGQALLNISKFHGPNWLLAGSLQATSAAYLTRVVSRSLADFMAINKGVSEPDLEFIKNNSDKIVENAFESEKINWKSLVSDFNNPLSLKIS